MSSRRPGFSPSVHVRFIVDRVALWQVPSFVALHWFFLAVHHSTKAHTHRSLPLRYALGPTSQHIIRIWSFISDPMPGRTQSTEV
jgi:hypothetical protein